MPEIVCPHCQAVNQAGDAFCAACGKALPRAESSGPRVVDAKEIAQTSAGRDVQGVQLERKIKSARTALFAVAVLQLIAGGLLMWLMHRAHKADPVAVPESAIVVTGAVVFGLAVVFAVLGIWAKTAPLPATITGLVIYVTALTLDALVDPKTLVQGWIVKIIIIAFLVKGISAASQYRRLKQEAAAAPLPPAPR